MFKLQHSNTPILQHSKAHGYVPDVQLILAAMDLSSYSRFIKGTSEKSLLNAEVDTKTAL